MNKVKIGRIQLIAILANMVYGKSIGFSGGILARMVGNDSWIAMSIAFIAGAGIMFFMVKLALRFGTQEPYEYTKRLLGKPAGKVIMVLLALFFIGVFIGSAVTIEYHINDFAMPETPFIVFVAIYTIITIYGVYLGIEVAARFAMVGYLGGILIAVSMVIGSVDHFEPSRLLPFFDHGVESVFSASLVPLTDVVSATAAAIFLLPLTGEEGKRWMSMCWLGLALGALQTVVWPVFEVGLLGAEATAQYIVACMQLVRGVELGIYLHRYELIMLSFFAFAVFTQSLVALWLASKLIMDVFNITTTRTYWVMGIGLATIPVHFWLAVDRPAYLRMLAQLWTPIAIVLGLGIPMLLYIVAMLRPGVEAQKPAAGD